MKQVLCMIALLIGFISATSAQDQTMQTSIRGRILTEEKQPLHLANIALLTQDSTFLQGTCSRSDGSFEILPSAPGNYLLQVSSIGYKTLCQPCHSGDTYHWTLEADTLMLTETVVTATRPIFKLKNGKLETSVQTSLLASLNNANDVLKHIPGLRFFDGEYTVFGKGTPIIYIDNRLLQDISELDRLSASDIDKIELTTNPGAEYDATVKAVVRIRTLRKKGDGWGGNIRAGIKQGRRTNHNEQISLNYQKKGLSLLGMLYANYENKLRRQEVRYQIPSDVEWDITSQVRLKNKGLLAGGKASISYDFNSNHSLGASYEFHRTPSYYSGDTSEYVVQENKVLTDFTIHSSQGLQQNSKNQVNAYYQGTIKQLQINFTADLVRSKNYHHQEVQEESRTEGNRTINSYNHAGNRFYAAKLILTHPLWQGELKAGTDYTFIRREDTFRNLENLLPTTDSRIDESKIAAFTEYSLTLGQISILAGIRFEQAVSDYWEQDEYFPSQSRTYNDWCPTLSIDFPIGKTQANFSYTAKTNRPSFFQLRSTLNYNNRFIYEGGNPLLTPETIHDWQFSTLYKWIQLGVNYQYHRNAIAFMTKDYEENPDVVIFTMGNFKRQQYLTANVYLSPTIGIWKPETGIYFTQPFFKVTNQGVTKNMNRPNVYISLKNNFVLPHKWILSFDADYQSKGNYSAMLQHYYWGMDIAIRKAFLDNKLTINLQASDLFNTRYGSFMLFGPRLTYTKKSNPDSRNVSLNISYRFNATGKTYKGKHVSDNDLPRL